MVLSYTDINQLQKLLFFVSGKGVDTYITQFRLNLLAKELYLL